MEMREGVSGRYKLRDHVQEKNKGFWPTPNTMGGLPPKSIEALRREATITRKGRLSPANLRDCVSNMQNWPTPNVCGNYNRKGASKTSGDGLATKVKNWPTPQNRDWKGKSQRNGLPNAVQNKKWATPRKSMHKDMTTDRGKCNLGEQVQGQLNPDWAEWLMGWPIFWSSLEPIAELLWLGWGVDPADNNSIPRVAATNIKDRVNRLKAIGNGQVPQCMATAWEMLSRDLS
jgi:hypothetical protein